jgi:hypothetical protein
MKIGLGTLEKKYREIKTKSNKLEKERENIRENKVDRQIYSTMR